VAITWEMQKSAADSAAFFAKNAGPIQLVLGRLDAPQGAALLRDLERLWVDNNLATGGEIRTSIGNEYLKTLAIRR
jgi:hypothetical protein